MSIWSWSNSKWWWEFSLILPHVSILSFDRMSLPLLIANIIWEICCSVCGDTRNMNHFLPRWFQLQKAGFMLVHEYIEGFWKNERSHTSWFITKVAEHVFWHLKPPCKDQVQLRVCEPTSHNRRTTNTACRCFPQNALSQPRVALWNRNQSGRQIKKCHCTI